MTAEEIVTMLESTGFPVTYLQWPEKAVPALPYICYYFPNSNNFGADNVVYQKINALNVELYTTEKDFAAEELLENALGDASHFWQKSETYLTTEHMYEVLYQTEVILNE